MTIFHVTELHSVMYKDAGNLENFETVHVVVQARYVVKFGGLLQW
jgi:hypothetical protein